MSLSTSISGLGRDAKWVSEHLGARYAAICRLVDTLAIFSVGLSLFSPVSPDEDAEETKPWYEVATYDWLMPCQDDFTADPSEFLVSHNMDFNHMFKEGIPYTRASSEKTPDLKGTEVEKASSPWKWDKFPRGLLWRTGRQGIALILHMAFSILLLCTPRSKGRSLPRCMSLSVRCGVTSQLGVVITKCSRQ